MQNIWKITYHNFVVVNFSHKIATFMKKKKDRKEKEKNKNKYNKLKWNYLKVFRNVRNLKKWEFSWKKFQTDTVSNSYLRIKTVHNIFNWLKSCIFKKIFKISTKVLENLTKNV